MTIAQNNDEDIKGYLEIEEGVDNEDGTFTYHIKGSQETLDDLMSTFFASAIIAGIKSTKKDNDQFLKLKEAAADLERFLRVWEESDTLDYSPEVKDRREALTKILYGGEK